MEKNPFKWPIIFIGGIIVILSELFFNVPALLLWSGPEPFSPLVNFHSDLGYSLWNPVGARFYNAGQVVQGLAVILFVGGFYVWHRDTRHNVLRAGQIAGFLTGIGLIMNGIYSEDLMHAHNFWSFIIFLGIIVFMILVNSALLTHPEFMKPIGYFGFVIGLANMSFLFLGEVYPVSEFFAIYTTEAWAALILYNTYTKGLPHRDFLRAKT
ncbi:MAG: DUF998 domain-containing protein [Methanomicrobia archaeon]|nr:DUF998 domain-containing protein [Methanomicrobia archaeon]MCK4433596.1 DUF998 domain-containing protein [Methanomicrobia archaeon]MCK4636871.1 DUF998 domain-containing protein [Methanomicrobia archaeon]